MTPFLILLWIVGSIAAPHEPGASWWWAEGCTDEGRIAVETTPPGLGGGWCSPGGVATIYANAGWGEAKAGGEIVAMRVWLPVIQGSNQ